MVLLGLKPALGRGHTRRSGSFRLGWKCFRGRVEGRIAQRESASLTSRRSLVQSQVCPPFFSIGCETKGSTVLALFSFSGVKRGDKRPVLAAIRPHARTLEFPRRPRGTARRTPAAMYLTGDHDGLVTVAGPAVPRSARPGQGKRRLGEPPVGVRAFGGPTLAVPSPKTDLTAIGGGLPA